MGYRAIIIGNERILILDYHFTPANHYDSEALGPPRLSIETHGMLPHVGAFHWDIAYCTEKNNRWLKYYGIHNKFHTKEESGKHSKNKAQAKRKSRIRFRVEPNFGIMKENYNFGATQLRGSLG
ncbi:MAG: transposase [Promethearchaeota archaeon]